MLRPLLSLLACLSVFASAVPARAQTSDAPRRAEEAPGARASSKLRPARRARRVDVSFRDAALPELVRYVARVTGRRFILTGRTPEVRVSIISERPVTPAELYDGFVAALSMHGLAVVRSGRYHRIVAADRVASEPIPIVTDPEASVRPGALQLRIHRVPHGSVDEAAALLRNFSSPAGEVIAHPSTRTLLIRDTAENVRRMLSILEHARAPAPASAIHVHRLEHADPEAMARTLAAVAPGAVVTAPD